MTRALTIGIDASRAYVRFPTGTEEYAEQVIRHLVPLGGHHYVLYARRPPLRPTPEGAQVRVLSAPRMWTHTRLAWEATRRPPDALFVPAHVLPVVARTATVVTVHDLGFRRFPEAHPWLQRLYLEVSARHHVARATLLLADSEATRDDLLSLYGAAANRVRVCHLGVDDDLEPADAGAVSAARAAAGVPTGRRYLLHVGTIQPRKNLDRLVEAFAAIASRWPDVDLLLVGRPGWGRHDPAATALRCGVGDRVRMAGYVERRYLAGLLTGAVALAHPSLYEGFGLTVLEAMACGLPVAASDASSLPEVVGDAGLLVPAEDTMAWSEALERLLADARLRRALSDRGIARAACFSWDRCARRTLAAIEEAAQAGR